MCTNELSTSSAGDQARIRIYFFMKFLQRSFLFFSRKYTSYSEELSSAKKFMHYISLKGEDILVYFSVEE